MPPGLARQVIERLLQAVFELAAVGQAGQGVVGRLPGQVGDVLALLGHVVQHQHDAADLAVIDDRRTDQVDRHGATVQALDQPGMFGATLEAAAEHLFDQAAALFLGLLVHQAEQRRQRQALGMAGLPVGQLLGGGVHVADTAFHVSGNHRITNGLQGDLRPLLFFLQGAGKGLALGQQLAGAAPGNGNQEHRGQQVGDQQHPLQHARALAQGIAERLGGRGYPFVDGDNARLPVADRAGVDRASGEAAAHFHGQHVQLAQVVVADVPVVDGRLHVADVAKVAVEPDDPLDIVGVVAALQHGLARGVQVGAGLVQHFAQLVVALGHGDGLAIAMVGAVVAGFGVQVEVVDGVFLRLGPKAFARDIGTHGRERIKAEAAQGYLEDHNGDEGPGDAEQLWRF